MAWACREVGFKAKGRRIPCGACDAVACLGRIRLETPFSLIAQTGEPRQQLGGGNPGLGQQAQPDILVSTAILSNMVPHQHHLWNLGFVVR